MASFKTLMEHLREYPEIHPEVIAQKSLFCDGLTLAYHANEMNKDEALDTDLFYPSSRHYGSSAGYSRHFVKQLFKYNDDYEKLVAVMLQAVYYDMPQRYIYYKDHNEFIKDLGRESLKETEMPLYRLGNRNSGYFHDIDKYQEGSYMLDKVYASHTYKTLAKSLYELMTFFFNDYQFVMAIEVPSYEKRHLMDFTYKCRNYRMLSACIDETDGLTEVYPLSSKKFTGTMKVHCDKHGNYEIDIDEYDTEYRCPHCIEEERKARRRKEAEDFVTKAKTKFGDFYDYSLVEEDFESLKRGTVRIIHPEIGIFRIVPATHLKSTTGYPGRKKAIFPNTAK